MILRAPAPADRCRLAPPNSHWGRGCSPAIGRTTPDHSRSIPAARWGPYLDSPCGKPEWRDGGVVGSEFDRRSRAGRVGITKGMRSMHLAAAIGAMEEWIAGAAPHFGCWRATSGPRKLWWKDAATLWSPSNGQAPGGGLGRPLA